MVRFSNWSKMATLWQSCCQITVFYHVYNVHNSIVRTWISQWFLAKFLFLFFKNNVTRINNCKFFHHKSHLKPLLSYLPCIVWREYFSNIFNVKKCTLYSIKYGSQILSSRLRKYHFHILANILCGCTGMFPRKEGGTQVLAGLTPSIQIVGSLLRATWPASKLIVLSSRIFTHLATQQPARSSDSPSTHPSPSLTTWSDSSRLLSWLPPHLI